MGGPVQAAEAQRGQVGRVHVRVGLEVALDVPGVDPDQDDRHDPFQPDRFERQEGSPDGDPIGDGEVAHVVGEDARVDLHLVAGVPVPGDHHDRHAGHEHGERGEHERRTQDRPDAHRVRRLPSREEDRDDRDHRLWQGRPDGRQDGSDSTLGKFELPPEPFDAVREQFRPHQDDDEGDDEDDDVHGQTVTASALPTPIAMTARMAMEIPTISRSPSRA